MHHVLKTVNPVMTAWVFATGVLSATRSRQASQPTVSYRLIQFLTGQSQIRTESAQWASTMTHRSTFAGRAGKTVLTVQTTLAIVLSARTDSHWIGQKHVNQVIMVEATTTAAVAVLITSMTFSVTTLIGMTLAVVQV